MFAAHVRPLAPAFARPNRFDRYDKASSKHYPAAIAKNG